MKKSLGDGALSASKKAEARMAWDTVERMDSILLGAICCTQIAATLFGPLQAGKRAEASAASRCVQYVIAALHQERRVAIALIDGMPG